MEKSIETDWLAFNDKVNQYTSSKLLLKDEVYNIIGACMEVHNELGAGFLEKIYKSALELEFQTRGIAYEREKKYEVDYKGIKLPHDFYADFIIENKIILEVKATQAINDIFQAQLINYLAVSKCEVGLLINFSERSLKYKRFVFTKNN
jgi:GxxExxY protein